MNSEFGVTLFEDIWASHVILMQPNPVHLDMIQNSIAISEKTHWFQFDSDLALIHISLLLLARRHRRTLSQLQAQDTSGLLKGMAIYGHWNMYHIDLQMKPRPLSQRSKPLLRIVFRCLDLSPVKGYFKMAFIFIFY